MAGHYLPNRPWTDSKRNAAVIDRYRNAAANGTLSREASAQSGRGGLPPHLGWDGAAYRPWLAHPNLPDPTGLTPEQIAAQASLSQPWRRRSGMSAADRALLNHTESGTAGAGGTNGTGSYTNNAAVIDHYRNATANGTLAADVPRLSQDQQAQFISGRDYVGNMGAGVDSPSAPVSPGTTGSGADGAAAPNSYQDQQQALIDQQLNDALSAIGNQFSSLLADLDRQRADGSAQIDQAHQAAVDALGGIDQRALARDGINQADQQAYAAQGSQMLGADANNIMAALQASGVDTTQLQGRLAEQQGFAQQQSTIQSDLLKNLAGVAATGRDQNSALAELIQQGASGDLTNNAARLQSQLAVQQAQQEAAARQQSSQATYALNSQVNDQNRADAAAAAQAQQQAAAAAYGAQSKAAKNQRMIDAMMATGMSRAEAQLRVDSGTVKNWINGLDSAQRDQVQADMQAAEDAAVKADRFNYAVDYLGIDPGMAAAAVKSGDLESLIAAQLKPGDAPGWDQVYADNTDLARQVAAGDPKDYSADQQLAAQLAVGKADSDAARATAWYGVVGQAARDAASGAIPIAHRSRVPHIDGVDQRKLEDWYNKAFGSN